MKPNELIAVLNAMKTTIEHLNMAVIYDEVQIEALEEAIKYVELLPDFIQYVIDSSDLYICDCKCCDEFRTKRDELLAKVQENTHD